MLNKWIPFQVTAERKAAVVQEISEGSTPAPRFYVMAVISTMIATLGLVANSPAVIIGAMLVAPLMTPIFGVSLALVQGNPFLLARSLKAEIQGVAVGVLLSFLFGLIPLAIDPTPEMLARTQPNLLDLMVAIFAGVAGAYAMVDERISPSLPGVAIATAIVPPLANTGLCLALGEYMGGVGSFFLFLANFLSILLAASVIFALFGMGPRFQRINSKEMARRFGFAFFTFSIIAILFSYSLFKLVQKRAIYNSIEQGLEQELSQTPGIHLSEVILQFEKDKIHTLATVRTPTLILPGRVRKMQDALSEKSKRNIKLIIRNNIVKDIAPTGSTLQVGVQNLEGEFMHETITPAEKNIALAEQVIWEKLSLKPGFQLSSMEHHVARGVDLLVASIQCLYPLKEEEIKELEMQIRDRTQNDKITLLISSYIPMLQISRGEIRFEWSRYEELTPQKNEILDAMKARARELFEDMNGLYYTGTNFRIAGPSWNVLFEVVGIHMITPQERDLLNEEMNQIAGRPVHVSVWYRNELVLTEYGYQSYDDFVRGTFEDNVQKQEELVGQPAEEQQE